MSAVGEYAIFMLDVDGTVESWNVGAERIKGYAAHEIIGRSFEIFYPEEDRATGHPQRNLATALRTGSHPRRGGGCARTARGSGPAW